MANKSKRDHAPAFDVLPSSAGQPVRSGPPARDIVSGNLRTVMAAYRLSEAEAARRAGISQKGINNVLRAGETLINPTIETVEQIANSFGYTAAQFLTPDLAPPSKDEVSVGAGLARRLSRLIEDYMLSDEAGRLQISRIASEMADRAGG